MTATLALFIAIGGSSYAAIRVDSGDIADNSVRGRDIRDRDIRGKDIRPNTILGKHIRESQLRPVPRAHDASRLGGATLSELKVRCPDGTIGAAGTCIEERARPAEPFFGASPFCGSLGGRLPSYVELRQITGQIDPAGEWTSSVYRNPANGEDPRDQLEAVVVTLGGLDYRRALGFEQLPYRCVLPPSN